MSELKPFRWVIQRIKELAAENPDKIACCRYFGDEGAPCCIVGHVLAEAGIRPMDEDEDGYYIGNDTTSVLAGTLAGQLPWEELGIEAPKTTAELRWVAEVQTRQDRGHTWGWAVEMAGDV
ncbi:hypothetical protein SEA_YASSJOHNNY_70 [Mycobacterium phage YassJohnny]|nr:hypothetical protein SEA_YASSJOHNNY_70 [Mycobacterium phage YassJohnny]